MTAVFIAIFLALIVMIYFITVSIRIVVENVTKKVNSYFVDKLSEYDEDFNEKIDRLNELEEEKQRILDNIKVLKADQGNLKQSRFYKPRPIIRDIYIPTARYIDNEFFEDYKRAKNLLVLDKEQIIRTVMEKFPYEGDMDRYLLANSVLEQMNYQAVYDLSSFDSVEQLKLMDEILYEKEKTLLEEYVEPMIDAQEFDIHDFLSYLEEIRSKESPILTAYMGEEGEDYSHISDNIVCEYDDNVCEGIRIIYQNRVYDYSIYQSRKKSEKNY